MSRVNPSYDLLKTYQPMARVAAGTLAPSDSSGHNGRMEARVTNLEETVVEVRDRLARIETKLEYVATREDLVRTESRLEGKLASLESRLEGKLASLENRMIKWFVGTAVTLFGLFSALVGTLVVLLR